MNLHKILFNLVKYYSISYIVKIYNLYVQNSKLCNYLFSLKWYIQNIKYKKLCRLIFCKNFIIIISKTLKYHSEISNK